MAPLGYVASIRSSRLRLGHAGDQTAATRVSRPWDSESRPTFTSGRTDSQGRMDRQSHQDGNLLIKCKRCRSKADEERERKQETSKTVIRQLAWYDRSKRLRSRISAPRCCRFSNERSHAPSISALAERIKWCGHSIMWSRSWWISRSEPAGRNRRGENRSPLSCPQFHRRTNTGP